MFKNLFTTLIVLAGCLTLAGCLGQSVTSQKLTTKQDQQESGTAGKMDSTETTEASSAQSNAGEQDKLHPALINPELANKAAPDKFRVKFETTKGDFIVEVNRQWSPLGADRFYNLVDIGFFKDMAIFRAVAGFMFQFGIHGNPGISEHWREANIKDDTPKGFSNRRGTISFANAGPHTRSTQMFINLGNNARLDGMGFTPFGKVVEGMEVIAEINTEYGENSPEVQPRFQSQGNAFILKRFPNIDIIKSVTLVEEKEGN